MACGGGIGPGNHKLQSKRPEHPVLVTCVLLESLIPKSYQQPEDASENVAGDESGFEHENHLTPDMRHIWGSKLTILTLLETSS